MQTISRRIRKTESPLPISLHLQDWSPADKRTVAVGKGVVDWKKLFAASKTGGVKNYFVEVNMDALQASYPYLHDLKCSEARGAHFLSSQLGCILRLAREVHMEIPVPVNLEPWLRRPRDPRRAELLSQAAARPRSEMGMGSVGFSNKIQEATQWR